MRNELALISILTNSRKNISIYWDKSINIVLYFLWFKCQSAFVYYFFPIFWWAGYLSIMQNWHMIACLNIFDNAYETIITQVIFCLVQKLYDFLIIHKKTNPLEPNSLVVSFLLKLESLYWLLEKWYIFKLKLIDSFFEVLLYWFHKINLWKIFSDYLSHSPNPGTYF